MATILLRSDGKRPVIGDDLSVTVTANVPAGITFVLAKLTFKEKPDSPSSPVIASSTTASFSGTTKVVFTFLLTKAQTANFLPLRTYYWDVEAESSSGETATVIPDGECVWLSGVTTP